MAMATAIPHYTADEVRQFDDPRLRFEVIRGELFVSPAPRVSHQLLVSALNHTFFEYFAANPIGVVIPGPFEVEFSDDSAVQPDLLVVLDTQRSRLTPERHHGPPALVIEIISYSSKRTDRLQKRLLYVEEGVSEYWVVDPALKQLERWRAGDQAAEVLKDEVTWQPAPGAPPLRIALRQLFERSSVL